MQCIDEAKNYLLSKYPGRRNLTEEIFEVATEMMSVDYVSVWPIGKRVRIFKDYMLSILEMGLEGNCPKGYMLGLLKIFEGTNMVDLEVRHLRALFMGWQGYGEAGWKRLEDVRKFLS